MIHRPPLWYLLLLTALWPGAVLGGAFVNLGFDEPDLTHLQIDASSGMPYGPPEFVAPGWTITQDGLPTARVWYYDPGPPPPITHDSGIVPLVILNKEPGLHFQYYINYLGDYFLVGGAEVKTAISFSQSGAIPAGTKSLAFYWSGQDFHNYQVLHVNGESVPFSSDPQRPPFYTSDISRWAGQEVTLSFDFPAGNNGILDNLKFVPETVPEPSTWALFGVGGLALAWNVIRRRAG